MLRGGVIVASLVFCLSILWAGWTTVQSRDWPYIRVSAEEFIRNEGRKARYDAGISQTVGPAMGSAAKPRLVTLMSRDLIILQRQGARVARVNRDGSVPWSIALHAVGIGLEVVDDRVVVASSAAVHWLDVDTGEFLNSELFDFPLSGLGRLDDDIVVAASSSAGSITKVDDVSKKIATAQYARHAIDVDGDVVVADTFGHQAASGTNVSRPIIRVTFNG